MSWLRGERKFAIILVTGIAIAISGLWATLSFLPPLSIPEEGVALNLTVEAFSWNVSYSAETTNRTVLSFLLEAADNLGFEVGWTRWDSLQAAKIDAINGVRDGQGGFFWQYWVNDEYGQVGADRYILQDGDRILWRHTTYPPEAGNET